MAPKGHSPYSPSKSEIYFNCPGSIASQAEVPSSPQSRSAKAGQRAHYLGEISLKEDKHPRDYLFETIRNDENGDSFTVNEDLAEAVGMYYEFLKDITNKPNVELLVEHRLEAEIAGQTIYGTCDAICIDGATLHITDYKHGVGDVEAHGNKQMLIYALLACLTLGEFTDIHLSIVQPNQGGVKEWWTNVAELEQFKADLENAIEETLNNPNKLEPGDHCLWCDAKASCGAYQASAPRLLGTRNSVVVLPQLTSYAPNAIADYIRKMSEATKKLRSSLKQAENIALGILQDGGTLPGLELHEARPSRDWADTKKTIEHFKNDPKLFETKMRSPAGVQKALGISKKELDATGLVTTKPGTTALKKTWETNSEFEDLDNQVNPE